MGQFDFIIKSKFDKDAEILHFGTRKVKGTLSVFRYIDKDTKQYVTYIPSLDISGYGETTDKAEETLSFSLSEFFDYIISLPIKRREAELLQLGWKKNRIRNKDFSKTKVETDLSQFNAEANSIEQLSLVA